MSRGKTAGERLATIETHLEYLVKAEKRRGDSDEALDDRLRKVENRQHWYSGASAVVGFIGAFMFDLGRRQL